MYVGVTLWLSGNSSVFQQCFPPFYVQLGWN